jgi:thiamine-phosphate pyrophosphorylase
MRLIIFSPPEDIPGEPQIVEDILTSLPVTFHLRKPGRTAERIADYLNAISGAQHDRIMIHGHGRLLERFNLKGIHFTEHARHRQMQIIRQIRRERPACRISSAFHRIADIPEDGGPFDYCFLSPIFDSISKQNYPAAFDHTELAALLSRTGQTVIGLGGIDEGRVATAARLGFKGVAVLGAVWRESDPQKAAARLWARCAAIAGHPEDFRSGAAKGPQ